MRPTPLALLSAFAFAGCGTTPADKNAEEAPAPAVYRAESATGSNFARRQVVVSTDEDSARAQQDAEALMRAEQIRRANLPRPGTTAVGR